MTSSLFPVLSPEGVFLIFLLILAVVEGLRGLLRYFAPAAVLLIGALLGQGGIGLILPGESAAILLSVGAGILWFYLGMESGAGLPKKRLAATLSFSILTAVLGAGAVTVALYFLGFNLSLAAAAGILVSSRGIVPLDSLNETKVQTRGTPIAAGAGAYQGFVILTGVVTAGLFRVFPAPGILMGSGLQWIVHLSAAGGIILGLPWILRMFLRRFSEDSSWVVLFLMGMSLGLGLLGKELLGWPLEAGLFLGGFGVGRVIPPSSSLKGRWEKILSSGVFLPVLLVLGLTSGANLYLTSWEPWAQGGLMALALLLAPLMASGLLRIWYAYSGGETLHTGLLFTYPGLWGAAGFALAALYVPEVLVPGLLTFTAGSFFGPLFSDMVSKALVKKGNVESPILEGQGRRIMVSLSNPDTASHLVEVSLALHAPDNPEPLYPVIVVPEGPESDKAVIKAERMLTSAMARVVATGIPVVPVTSIDVNITSGLARVSRARRIGLMILGWNGQYTVQRSIFGSVLDQTVKTSRLELFVLKSSGTLNGVKRLQVGLPPLVETQQGFDQALADLVLFGSRLGCEYLFYGMANTVHHIEDRLRTWRTPGEKSFEVLNDWKLLLDRWKNRLGTPDMLVLFSLRQNQLAWQPSLDRWPRQVAQNFPAHPFLVIYPREGAETSEEDEEAFESGLRKEVTEDLPKIILHMQGSDVASALRQLLQIDFYGETLEKTSVILDETARNQPVELKPGVVLVHAHLNIVDDFSVYWGVNPQGWTLPELTQEVKILVVLISPLAEGPEMHLRKLAELARLIGRTDWTEELLKADSREDLVKKIPKYRV